jgi:hypothetical protein
LGHCFNCLFPPLAPSFLWCLLLPPPLKKLKTNDHVYFYPTPPTGGLFPRRPTVPLHIAHWWPASHTAYSHDVLLFLLWVVTATLWPLLHTPFSRHPMAGPPHAAHRSATYARIRSIRVVQLLAACYLQLTCASASFSTAFPRSRPTTYAIA